jgi:protein TonB
MTALALHFSERRGLARWTLAALAIVAAHAAIIAGVALWYERTPPESNIIPAIAISFEPQAAAQAQSNDAIAEQKIEQAEVTPEPPKLEEPKVEQPQEQVVPPPPTAAEVTLPKPEPKRAKEKPVEQKRQEARAIAAPSEIPRRATVAASNAYNSLVYGHLQRFRRASGSVAAAKGTVSVHFVLSREGQLLSSAVTQSSGNATLDREALAILNRANPFPPFPAEKTIAKDSFDAPIQFAPPR